MSCDFPVPLVMRLADWSVGRWRSAAVFCVVRLCVVCRVVLHIPRSRHIRLVADTLARMSRECYEETASV